MGLIDERDYSLRDGIDSLIPHHKLKVNCNGSRGKTFQISRDKLKVLYCNERSIRNKMDDLKGLLATETIDIIGITES